MTKPSQLKAWRSWAERNKQDELNRQKIKKRQSRYNLKEEKYQAMLLAQQGMCAICGKVMTKPHIDHDHACCPGNKTSCGKCIRGLLCIGCNNSLGHFKDSPEMLQRAISYLEKGKNNG